MTLNTTVAIDMDDSKFVRFKELFDRYSEALRKQPEIWQKIGGIHQQHAEHFSEILASMGRISQLRHKNLKDSEDEEKHLTIAERLWTSIGRSTKDVSHNIENATRSFLKWSGILTAVGGLLGLGGLWGIDRMAAGLSRQRFTAAGAGVSIGQQQAFGLAFGGRLLEDPGGFLGWIASMQQDISKQRPAFSLLGRKLGTDTDMDAMAMMDAIRHLATTTDLNLLGPLLHARGVDLSDADLRRFHDMSPGEYKEMKGMYAKNIGTLGVSDRDAEAWVRFTKQMDLAGQTMEKTFQRGLVKLAGPLERLSSAATHLVGALLGSQAAKEAITFLAKETDKFAKYLASPAFTADVKGFMDGVESLASGLSTFRNDPLGTVEGWAKGLFNTPEQRKAIDQQTFGNPAWWTGGLKGGESPHDRFLKNYAGNLLWTDRLHNIGDGMLESIALLQTLNPRAGGVGPFGLLPGESKGIDPRDKVDSALREASLISQLMSEFHGNRAQALAAKYWNPEGVEGAIKKFGTNWQLGLPVETRAMLKQAMHITVQSATGSDLVVTTSQLGPQGIP
jgi:hypothetical protein